MNVQEIPFNPESMILRSPKAFKEYCHQFYSRPCFKQFKNPGGFAPSSRQSSGVVVEGIL
jgi:hypothetical protein